MNALPVLEAPLPRGAKRERRAKGFSVVETREINRPDFEMHGHGDESDGCWLGAGLAAGRRPRHDGPGVVVRWCAGWNADLKHDRLCPSFGDQRDTLRRHVQQHIPGKINGVSATQACRRTKSMRSRTDTSQVGRGVRSRSRGGTVPLACRPGHRPCSRSRSHRPRPPHMRTCQARRHCLRRQLRSSGCLGPGSTIRFLAWRRGSGPRSSRAQRSPLS